MVKGSTTTVAGSDLHRGPSGSSLLNTSGWRKPWPSFPATFKLWRYFTRAPRLTTHVPTPNIEGCRSCCASCGGVDCRTFARCERRMRCENAARRGGTQIVPSFGRENACSVSYRLPNFCRDDRTRPHYIDQTSRDPCDIKLEENDTTSYATPWYQTWSYLFGLREKAEIDLVFSLIVTWKSMYLVIVSVRKKVRP